jgi:glycosyltransferase involved in cell wall biosynthesis
MNKRPLVSILINNYNYGKFLAEAIDSALAQTYSYCETIVVDDGSTDNSREIISSYNDRIIPIFQENGGQASAFNTGFAASKGEIICFLDSDDLFLPEKAGTIVEAFNRYTDSDWFYHSLDYQNDINKPTNVFTDRGEESKLLEVWDLRSALQKNKLKVKFPNLIPATSGICFTRSLLNKILPMPEGKGIVLNENYLKFLAIALSKGLTIDRFLAVQRIHENNAFTCQTNQDFMTNNIHIINAYWIRVNFPHLSGYADKLFASGLGQSRHFAQEQIDRDKDPIAIASRQVVKNYFSLTTPIEQQIIRLKAFLYYLKR